MTKKSPGSKTRNPLLDHIADLALEKKANGVVSLDVRVLSSITDHYLICSADTEPQVKAIADNIRRGTLDKPWHLEGYEKLKWVLLDYVDLVVHVFRSEERYYYNLEKLWADAPIMEFSDEDTEKTTD